MAGRCVAGPRRLDAVADPIELLVGASFEIAGQQLFYPNASRSASGTP